MTPQMTEPDIGGRFLRDTLARTSWSSIGVRTDEQGRPIAFGYIVPYGQWAEIDSPIEGHFMEQIAPGAFTKTLQENRERFRYVYHHGRDSSTGLKPLGSIVLLEERAAGPYYEVALFDDAGYVRELMPAMREEQMGTSFLFRIIKDDPVWRPKPSDYNPKGLPERTVLELQMKEFGPTPFSVYEGTKVGVRSITHEFVPLDRAEMERASDRLYQRSIELVSSSVWAMTPDALAVVMAVLRERAAGHRPSLEEIMDRIGVRAEPPELEEPETELRRNVATIPVRGPIVPKGGMFDRTSRELTSVESLQRQFRDAMSDEQVHGVLFDIDSPGGHADLIPEFAQEIRMARGTKPIVALANTMAASGAYWIGTAADELLVTPSGQVGSVGVWTAHEDISSLMEQKGIKTTLVSAGEHKVEGNPFEPLSNEAREEMQRKTDAYYKMFVEAVAEGRGISVPEVEGGFGQGRMALAEEAVQKGMADGVATLDEAVASLQGRVAEARAVELAGAVARSGVDADSITSTPTRQDTPKRQAPLKRARPYWQLGGGGRK